MLSSFQKGTTQNSEKTSSGGLESSANQNQTKGNSNEYYEEYCKVFMANAVLHAQYNEIKSERDMLAEKLERLQKRQGASAVEDRELKREKQSFEGASDKKNHKRERRTAIEIARDHRCPVETCGKAYGSDTALNLHVRTKHPNYKQD
mmetsp:Transcript_38352/g.44678  ORF Transcript_38352/g.44678 Transcript_38352/m.44678 type:complete len:148 (-) Transcript_38352:143-586(-)